MPDLKATVFSYLKDLPQNKDQSLIGLLTELGYNFVREDAIPLIREWTERQKELIDNIEILADYDDFKIFWIRLKNEKLLRTEERTVLTKLTSQYPFNLIIFSNIDDTLWDFVNIKLVSEKVEENSKEEKRKLVRRIRIDDVTRLHTACERIEQVKLPEEGLSSLDIQSIHDKAFDVEEVTDKFFKGVVRKGQVVEKGFIHIFKSLKEKLYSQSNDKEWAHNFTMQFLSRIMFIYFIQNGIPTKKWTYS